MNQVIESFQSTKAQPMLGLNPDKGIPLGNVSSQIFANIYLNELDQFVKHKLKIKHYLRYADDFIMLESSKDKLLHYINILKSYLDNNLKLELHPKKIILRKLIRGIDFCGYIVLPHFILPRTKTKRRIMRTVSGKQISEESFQSYLGYFSHAKSYKNVELIKSLYYLNHSKFS